MDLNTEKNERPKLCTTIRQLEVELTQLRRQVNEPSPSSLPVLFRVNPPCSAAFQDTCALNNAQISKPSITNTQKEPRALQLNLDYLISHEAHHPDYRLPDLLPRM